MTLTQQINNEAITSQVRITHLVLISGVTVVRMTMYASNKYVVANHIKIFFLSVSPNLYQCMHGLCEYGKHNAPAFASMTITQILICVYPNY